MTGSAPTDSTEGSDPFDLADEKQLEVIRHVRRRVKDLESVRERIELQMQELQKQAAAFEEDPEVTTDIRDERPAQDLRPRRSAIGGQIADLKFQVDLVAAQEWSLRTTSRRLQRHVERFRTEKELLKTSYNVADALIAAVEAMSVASTATVSASEASAGPSTDLQARRCSFCGSSERAVHKIIAGPDVNICNECVELCQEIIDDESSTKEH